VVPFFVIALFIFILDQASKWWIVNHMFLYQSIPVIDHFFSITSHRNRGAAFGILQNQTWLFIVITICVVIAIIIYMLKSKDESLLTKSSLTFILGGAFGNLLDRIRTGEVVDFFHFQFGNYQFPIFNVADSAVCIGVALFILATFLVPEEKQLDTTVGDA
jgi:signal peptidase II